MNQKRTSLVILGFILLQSIILFNLINNSNSYNKPESEIKLVSSTNINPLKQDFSSDYSSSENLNLKKIDDEIIRQFYQSDVLSELKPSKYVKFLILFTKDIPTNDREIYLKSICPNIQIHYNYKLIPAISVTIPLEEARVLISISNSLEKISYVSINHQLKIQPPLITNPSEIDSNWEATFSLENWWLDAIGLEDIPYTGKGVKLAIMDTGITVHPDFFVDGKSDSSRIKLSINFAEDSGTTDPTHIFDDYGHGTHVAGIAGGNGYLSNGLYQGVAPNVDLINVRALNSSGAGEEDDIIAGIEWCVENEIDIISMSFGGDIPEVWNIENIAIQEAVKKNVTIIAASGNSGPYFYTSGSPGSGLYSIAVGATDINDHVTEFSSIGPSYTGQLLPDVCAPGMNIIAPVALDSIIYRESAFLKTFIGQKHHFAYVSLSGTSMATPMVSGAVAILLEAFPDATPETIRNALIMGARSLERPTNEGYGAAQGAGLINISASLQFLEEIKNHYSSVNEQVKAFPRIIPYAPFDFLRFPGDHQIFNTSIYAASARNVTIQVPDITGITISATPHTLKFIDHDYQSLVIDCEIDYDAIPQVIFDYINISDTHTGQIYDQILINFTITYPRGKIIFDNFHGLTDIFPQKQLGISQMDLYHAMYDLYQMNFQLDFAMQNWTPGYDANQDASLITPTKLAGADILVLTTPRIIFSPLEIATIEDFYSTGGSLLFLGTKVETICISSINDLFTRLNCGIQINPSNVISIYDLGYTTALYSIHITDIDQTSPFFSGVTQYEFAHGNSFQISGTAFTAASYGGKIIASGYDGHLEGKGRVAALGSFHVFTDSYYNDPNQYGNHSLILKNIINFLSPIGNARININLGSRVINDSNLAIAVDYYNPITQTVLSDTVTLSIVVNDTVSSLLDLDILSPGHYLNNTILPIAYRSPNPITLYAATSLTNITRKFCYYPNSINGYTNITTNPIELNRWTDANFNITCPNLYYNLTGYFTVNPISYFSSNPTTELELIINDTFQIQISHSELKCSGLAWFYCETNYTQNEVKYRDLTPNRYSFWINNINPSIELSNSSFSGIILDDTEDNGMISILQTQFDKAYELKIYLSDHEDGGAQLAITASLLQVLSYNQSIVPIYSSPRYYSFQNPTSNLYTATISFPETLTYRTNNQATAISIESDFETYFTLFWITVRDNDGGNDEFLLLFAISHQEMQQSNYTPLIFVFLVIGVSIFILQQIFRSKIPQNTIVTCAICGFQNNKDLRICRNCGNQLH